MKCASLPEDNENGNSGDPSTRIAIHPALPDWIKGVIASFEATTIDEEFIGWTVTAQVRNGERRVRRYHLNRWNARRRVALQKFRLTVKAQRRRIRQLEKQAQLADTKFRRTAELVRWFKWHAWGAFKFILILAGMFAIMLAGWTSTFVLLRTNSEFADHPAVCVAIGAMVAIAVVAVKYGIEQFKTEVQIRRVAWTLSGSTLVLALTYAALLAFVTGGFGRQVLDPAAMAEAAAAASNHGLLCILLFLVDLWLGFSAGLTLFAYAQQIYLQHRTEGVIANPLSWMRRHAKDEAETELRLEQDKLENLLASPAALRAARNEFVEKAATLYLARAKTAQLQRQGIDAKSGRPPKPEQPASWIGRLGDFFGN